MNWDDVAEMVRVWNGQFCLKGIMSVTDAKRAVDIGCTGIILSNHGGRQLEMARARLSISSLKSPMPWAIKST
jgi:L-lactate dehydrogenase (cytochrome)